MRTNETLRRVARVFTAFTWGTLARGWSSRVGLGLGLMAATVAVTLLAVAGWLDSRPTTPTAGDGARRAP